MIVHRVEPVRPCIVRAIIKSGFTQALARSVKVPDGSMHAVEAVIRSWPEAAAVALRIAVDSVGRFVIVPYFVIYTALLHVK